MLLWLDPHVINPNMCRTLHCRFSEVLIRDWIVTVAVTLTAIATVVVIKHVCLDVLTCATNVATHMESQNGSDVVLHQNTHVLYIYIYIYTYTYTYTLAGASLVRNP